MEGKITPRDRTVLSLLSTLAIVAGESSPASSCVNSTNSAVNIVFDLPEGLTKKDIEERPGDRMTGVLVMFGTFEIMGILI